MAWLAEAQAVETEKAGPFSPRVIEMCEAGAETIRRGTTKGCTRLFPSSKTAR